MPPRRKRPTTRAVPPRPFFGIVNEDGRLVQWSYADTGGKAWAVRRAAQVQGERVVEFRAVKARRRTK